MTIFKKSVALLAILSLSAVALAQSELQKRPKLVVGIMVDQMRWDYLIRYAEQYGEGGFKRLMNEGYNCNHLLINYVPTVTAVGHTAVYSGTVPAFNGIIANNMFFDGKWDTPVRDWNTQGVGTSRSEGQASPHRLMTTTMTDELRLATNFRSKVISVSVKDRGSILPGGHCANAAYWMDSESMDFVTSTYYMNELPRWVTEFNRKKLGAKYLKDFGRQKDRQGKYADDFWKLSYPERTYVQSGPLHADYYDQRTGTIIKYLPQGNTLTTDMAIAALSGEQLGKNPSGQTDFLAISYSCTDMIAHKVGCHAPWVEDTYIRLDKDLKRLFDMLDRLVGKGEWTAFLSADHAGTDNVKFRQEHGIPADTWAYYREKKTLNDSLRSHFHLTHDIVTSLECMNVYLSDSLINVEKAAGNGSLTKDAIIDYLIGDLKARHNIAYAFRPTEVPTYIPEPVRSMVINGYCPGRSGEIVFILQQGVTEDYDDGYKADYDGIPLGTNHAVWSPNDSHIPFIVMGKGVRHAWDNHSYTVCDIAATICAYLNIQQPSACIGNAIDITE